MADSYRVVYANDEGERRELEGECYGAIRGSAENDALIAEGFRFVMGHRIFPRQEPILSESDRSAQ